MNRNDITDIDLDARADGLKTIGWVSYILHLIVAVGAVIPGAQPGAALLIIALVIDLVKKSDAEGTWPSAPDSAPNSAPNSAPTTYPTRRLSPGASSRTTTTA